MEPNAALRAIYEKCEAILGQWSDSQQRMVALQQEQALISQAYADCQAAARLFGVNLEEGYPKYLEEKAAASPTLFFTGHAPNITVSDTPLPLRAKISTIREFILEEAQRAHPNPVTARELREKLAQSGVETHPKTIGMSLFRLSKERMMRREGKANWYFVPEDQRSVDPGEVTSMDQLRVRSG